MNDIFLFMGSYLIIVLGCLVFFNWLSNGYLIKLISVKSSRGRKILIHIRSKLQYYTITGALEGDFIVYMDREAKRNKQKTPKRVVIDSAGFFRDLGVWNVNIDEASNNILKPTGETIAGFDAIKYANLYERALLKPTPENKEKIIVIIVLIVVIIVLFLGIANLVRLQQIDGAIKALGQVGKVAGVNV